MFCLVFRSCLFTQITLLIINMEAVHLDNSNLSWPQQHLQTTVQALQAELRIQRDLNQLLQPPGEPLACEPGEEQERQARELFLLRHTLEEMELRLETQRQTLAARDDSVKKLLEMLHSKGPSTKATEEDHELTCRLADAEMHAHHLENLLEQRDKEMVALREVSTRYIPVSTKWKHPKKPSKDLKRGKIR